MNNEEKELDNNGTGKVVKISGLSEEDKRNLKMLKAVKHHDSWKELILELASRELEKTEEYVDRNEVFEYTVKDKNRTDSGVFELVLLPKSRDNSVRISVPYSLWREVSRGDSVRKKTVYEIMNKSEERG